MSELEEFLSYQDNPPALTEAVQVEIEKDGLGQKSGLWN